MGPIEALQLFAAACSIASYLKDNGLDVELINIRSAIQNTDAGSASNETIRILESVDSITLINLLVIDPELLKTLRGLVDDAQKDHSTCMSNAGKSIAERDKCDILAQRDICDLLNRIRDRNDDELPVAELMNLWTSWKCVRIERN